MSGNSGMVLVTLYYFLTKKATTACIHATQNRLQATVGTVKGVGTVKRKGFNARVCIGLMSRWDTMRYTMFSL